MTTLYRPMTPGGGAFLTCVGASLLIGSFLAADMIGTALTIGFAGGALALVAASIAGRMRGLPKPATRDILLVWLCVAAELIVFFVLAPLIPMDPRTSVIFVIAVVGAHFLPMAWSFGPLIGLLGLACLSVAAIGQFASGIPLIALTIADALLKLGFGAAMLAGLLRIQKTETAVTAQTA